MLGSVGGPGDEATRMMAGRGNCVSPVRPLHTDPGPTDTGVVETKVGAVPPTIVGGSIYRLRTSTLRRVQRVRERTGTHSYPSSIFVIMVAGFSVSWLVDVLSWAFQNADNCRL